MSRLVKLAAAVVLVRELARLYHRFDPDTLTVGERVGRVEELLDAIRHDEHDAFVMNIPRRLHAVEAAAAGTAASAATLSRAVATLEDRVDELAAPTPPDA